MEGEFQASGGGVTVRRFSWFPVACFVALLATMATVQVLPPEYRLAYAVVEWVEMAVGTVSAVVAFVVFFLRRRAASPAEQSWTGSKWLTICGLSLWSIFWLIAALARPWTD
jgi:uncharacterized membrane protein